MYLGPVVAWAINMGDDIMFAQLDMAYGMDTGMVLEGLGKKALISAGTVAIGAGATALSNSCVALQGVVGSTLLKGAEIAVTNVNTSVINSINFRNLVSGKDAFDENGFMEGAFGTDAMTSVAAGMVGNLITRGMSQANIGANGIKVDAFNSFQISQMQGLNSFVGSMASAGVTYAMTDRVTFNVARIAGTGVLEMNVGKGGFSMNLGTGGTDISLGTISSAMSGLSHWNTNLKIEKKAQSLELDIATALRSQYGFGDRNARAQLDSILDGSTDLRKREGSTGDAQTVLENGKRVVYLDNYHDGMSREQQFRMGITLQHEAYRNGIVDKNNKAETQVAAYAHTLMTERVMSDTRYSSLMGTVISRDANLAADLAMLNKARENRDLGVFASYVDATYDSSGDNWLFKMDGSIEDTVDKAFYREYIDENGVVSKQKIEDSEYTGSRAAALVKAIGIENVRATMLYGSSNSLSELPVEVIASACGCSLEAAEQMKVNPSIAPDLMREGSETQAKLIGELLLYENGSSWNSSSNKWTGGTLMIPGLELYDSLGVNRNTDGSYEFFTAGMDLTRDNDAFDSWKDGITSPDYNVRDNTSVKLWKRDLFQPENNIEHSFDGAWTSIDIASENTVIVNGNEYKSNTIISENFNMYLIPWENSSDSNYGVSKVGIANGAITLDGRYINSQGRTKPNESRWLFPHPFSPNAGSEGCGGPMSNNGIAPYNVSTNTYSGAWYQNQFLNKVGDYKIYDGYNFHMRIRGRVRP